MIEIKEFEAFNQTIVAVLNDSKILSLRAGIVSKHELESALFHAKKLSQEKVKITRLDGSTLYV